MTAFHAPSSPARAERGSSLRPALRVVPLAGLLCGVLVVGACGGGGGSSENFVSGGGPNSNPITPSKGNFTYPAGFEPSPGGFFLDSNEQGKASSVRILDILWGRLTDVYDRDPLTGVRTLRHRDYLIGEDIISDGSDFDLEVNPVTEQAILTILHEAGTPAYKSALNRLDDGLGPILPKSLAPNELPPFSFLPRNGAISIRFSDLLDHSTINAQSVEFLTGNPPQEPFEPRLVIDPNHGGLVSTKNGNQFRSTRVIVDMTVSELEAQQGASVPVNSLGLPGAVTTALPNVVLRLATEIDAGTGHFTRVENHTGHGLAQENNGPIQNNAPRDLVRAMRSGGESSITGDDNNGFLLDLNAPRIIGGQPITITSLLPDTVAGPERYIVDLQFASVFCAQTPEPGDVIEQAGVFAEVVEPSAAPALGLVEDVRVRLVGGDAEDFIAGQGVFSSVFEAGDQGACFVSFSPVPATFPVDGVAPMSQLAVRFSEPMDPASVKVFDTFTVTREPVILGLTDVVVGDVVVSTDLREFRFVPVLPFAHTVSASEDYFFTMAAGEDGLTDLAGNPLEVALPQVTFTLNPSAPTENNGGLVLRFSSPDEDNNGNPEWTGQFLFDAGQELIRPRPVSRFAAVADRTQAVPSAMIPFPLGVQTPLSPLGSRLHYIYRYFDVGFSATDETNHNVDVERMNWAPVGGQVNFDSYHEFEMRLSHCRFLPDEVVSASSLLPTAPNSGLLPPGFNSFDDNVLSDPENSLRVVHPRSKGYLVNPVDRFTSSTGTIMMPYPLNREPDIGSYAYYTWRDTAIRATAAPNGQGIDPAILVNLGGSAGPPGNIARANFVPSFGLPLLMEFRCYPADDAVGLNAFDISLAINSSSRPTFRVFSTGGTNTAGNPVQVNPDLATAPSGGFNPNSNPPGQSTPGRDNVFYIGQLDLVTRISRAHSVFFAVDNNPDYITPVVEPSAELQPTGTEVLLAYRGATQAVNGPDGNPTADAGVLDVYGDLADNNQSGLAGDPSQKNTTVTFLNGDNTWKASIDEVDGARFLQIRLTFVNNTESGLSPELSALGFAYIRP